MLSSRSGHLSGAASVRNTIAAALTLLLMTGTAGAAGWKTTIVDKDGIRSISLIGLVGETEAAGIAVTCTGMSEGLPATIFATSEPWLDFAIQPGESATLALNAYDIPAEITANDSHLTMVRANSFDLDRALRVLDAMDDMSVVLIAAGPNQSQLVIPDTNRRVAFEQFRTACAL